MKTHYDRHKKDLHTFTSAEVKDTRELNNSCNLGNKNFSTLKH